MLQCLQGVFSSNKLQEYEFLLVHSYSKVIRSKLEKAILLEWVQGKGGPSAREKSFESE